VNFRIIKKFITFKFNLWVHHIGHVSSNIYICYTRTQLLQITVMLYAPHSQHIYIRCKWGAYPFHHPILLNKITKHLQWTINGPYPALPVKHGIVLISVCPCVFVRVLLVNKQNINWNWNYWFQFTDL